MNNIDTEIFACSVARMLCRMKLYGNADIATISTLKVLYKYKDYLWYSPDDTHTVQNDWQHKKKGILLDLERKLIEKCRDICRGAEVKVSPVKTGVAVAITPPVCSDEFTIVFDTTFGVNVTCI